MHSVRPYPSPDPLQGAPLLPPAQRLQIVTNRSGGYHETLRPGSSKDWLIWITPQFIPHARTRRIASISHLWRGAPQNLDETRPIEILVNDGYVVGFCPARLQPAWSAYRVAHAEDDVDYKRPLIYYDDLRLDEAHRIGRRTFGKIGSVPLNVGHMAPNEVINRQFGRLAQMETFLMSNMQPGGGRVTLNWRRLLEWTAGALSAGTPVWLRADNAYYKGELGARRFWSRSRGFPTRPGRISGWRRRRSSRRIARAAGTRNSITRWSGGERRTARRFWFLGTR